MPKARQRSGSGASSAIGYGTTIQSCTSKRFGRATVGGRAALVRSNYVLGLTPDSKCQFGTRPPFQVTNHGVEVGIRSASP
jgi:hypothetical protein